MNLETRRVIRFLFSLAVLVPAMALAQPRVDAKALAEQGEAAYLAHDLPSAMRLFRQAAEAGDTRAMARYADLLDIAEQNDEAVEWYRKSAAKNDPAGEYGLSRMMISGEGVARDLEQALALLRKAVEKDFPPAVEALARVYRAGALGLPKDPAEAQRLEAKAKALRDAQKTAK